MKPIINQIAAKVSEKYLVPIKNSMKALEKDLIINVETLKAEIKAGDARVKTFSQKLNDTLLQRLEDEVGLLRKTIVRNKSDFDMKYIETCEQQKVTRDALNRFQEYFNSLAGISAYLVENVNMQMEAELADLLDRRMMQLFAVTDSNTKLGDVKQQARETVNKYVGKEGKYSKLGKELQNKIEKKGIPELGLNKKIVKKRKEALPSLSKKVGPDASDSDSGSDISEEDKVQK